MLQKLYQTNRLHIIKFSILLFFLNCFSLTAQNDPIEPRNPIDEVWRKDMNIPVSGEIRTGLVFDIASENPVKDYFYVNLPEEKFNLLFVEITSHDGRYNASLSFDIEDKEAGLINLSGAQNFTANLKLLTARRLQYWPG
jgi:hypothetical protein